MTKKMFTPREEEAIRLLALPIKVAAHRMGITESAFKAHRINIQTKVKARNTRSLVVMLTRAGYDIELF